MVHSRILQLDVNISMKKNQKIGTESLDGITITLVWRVYLVDRERYAVIRVTGWRRRELTAWSYLVRVFRIK